MRNEGFHRFAASLAEYFHATEVCCVGLHQVGIEVELANQKAELVAEAGLEAFGTILAKRAIPVRRRQLVIRFARTRQRTQFLDGNDADSAHFAQGSVDGAGFGDTHLRPANRRRNVERICVPVTRKRLQLTGPVHNRSEDPTVSGRVREPTIDSRLYARTATPMCAAEQSRMCDVPSLIEQYDVAVRDRQLMCLHEGSQFPHFFFLHVTPEAFCSIHFCSNAIPFVLHLPSILSA